MRSSQPEQLAATFVYPTGGREAIDLAKQILIDCGTDVPESTSLDTLQATADNAAEVYGKLGGP